MDNNDKKQKKPVQTFSSMQVSLTANAKLLQDALKYALNEGYLTLQDKMKADLVQYVKEQKQINPNL